MHSTKSAITTREFEQRAATAWIRAADAGLIDAAELAWLLTNLPSEPDSAPAIVEQP